MRIVKIIVAMGMLLGIFSQIATAKDVMIANTKTKSQNKKEEIFSKDITNFGEGIFYGGYPRSKEEVKNEAILNRWKSKQTQKWKSLEYGKEFVINASAYTAAADECGWNTGITSSGIVVEKSRTLACPPEYPFGTKIEIDGYGTYRCEDRGGAIKGNHFDIYMETKADAFKFGRRNLIAQIVQ